MTANMHAAIRNTEKMDNIEGKSKELSDSAMQF
jgi:hypothetical protein